MRLSAGSANAPTDPDRTQQASVVYSSENRCKISTTLTGWEFGVISPGSVRISPLLRISVYLLKCNIRKYTQEKILVPTDVKFLLNGYYG